MIAIKDVDTTLIEELVGRGIPFELLQIKWSKEEAIQVVKGVLSGSGIWCQRYPECIRGKFFDDNGHTGEWSLAMECGFVHALMHIYSITLQDLGWPEEAGTGLFDWETGELL